MANYPKIIADRPEVADFIRLRTTLRYRGEVMAYPGNMSCGSFSTDKAGFRHTTLGGESFSVSDCLRSQRYGLVLGASNNFGFGIAGNENTMPSLLAERFGFPFANAAMPGATSRNLSGLLIAFLARSGTRPSIVVLSNGGDLAGFCEASMADAVFGPPNRGQLAGPMKEACLTADPDQHVAAFLRFTGLWTMSIGNLCRALKIPLVLIHQSTIFDKARPSATEREFELGKPFRKLQERQFDNFKKFSRQFYEGRKATAEGLAVPLAGWGLSDKLSFMDEFHLDQEGIRTLSNAVGDAVAPLLG
ncbi:hypothetical protein [Sphingomonas hankyongi]|uniref:SGNH hydrolase-type esterase domain-containing protein n=1 Tax=Sphingomonas hankyongi TaxID=2908209 RepID=A0ABT0RZP7_9SPHN|nr:hypothetical protein [Sphingomonas hankyongi]MCL6729093.1 hypothetical protein [Sphingomonas hankyongi]